jgi:hypothetical protein
MKKKSRGGIVLPKFLQQSGGKFRFGTNVLAEGAIAQEAVTFGVNRSGSCMNLLDAARQGPEAFRLGPIGMGGDYGTGNKETPSACRAFLDARQKEPLPFGRQVHEFLRLD